MPQSRRFRLACVALAIVGSWLVCAPVSAESSFGLVYRAPPGCPSRTEFVAQVRRETDRAAFSEAAADESSAFVVEIEPRASGYRGRLLREGHEPRALEDTSCVDVSAALALMLALAVDPDRGGPPAPVPAGPGQAVSAATARKPPAWPERHAEPPHARRFWGGLVRGHMVQGTTEDDPRRWGGGLGLEAGAAWRNWLWPSARLHLQGSAAEQAGARMQIWSGRVELTALRAPLGRLAVLPQLAFEVGSVRVRGAGEPAPAEQQRVWLALAEGLSFELTLSARFYLGLLFELLQPLRRYRFVRASSSQRMQVASLGPLELSAAISLGVRFW